VEGRGAREGYDNEKPKIDHSAYPKIGRNIFN